MLLKIALGPKLIVTRIAVQAQVSLFQRLLKRSSANFGKVAAVEAVRAGAIKFRLSDAHGGCIALPFFRDTRDLLHDSTRWLALPKPQRTSQFQALAFAMLAKACAAIFALMYSVQVGYPYKIFGLLTCEPDDLQNFGNELLRDVECLKDEWSKRFLMEFSTVETLTSRKALAILVAIGSNTPLDIGRIECRHATLRRILRARSQTHSVAIDRASADFLAIRHLRN